MTNDNNIEDKNENIDEKGKVDGDNIQKKQCDCDIFTMNINKSQTNRKEEKFNRRNYSSNRIETGQMIMIWKMNTKTKIKKSRMTPITYKMKQCN